ncbi:hypothetical protein F5Y05DRAFT_415606 [Hypoxylon sp. FL0543]|nr:hypothetical protein F5Y05DRAFT_415606 [Hypoxylon sp. FL0543]
MASSSQPQTANKAESYQRTPSQGLLTSPNEPIHSRLDDFIMEPLHDGNRNVMLPDRLASKAAAVKESRERMKAEIDELTAVISDRKH